MESLTTFIKQKRHNKSKRHSALVGNHLSPIEAAAAADLQSSNNESTTHDTKSSRNRTTCWHRLTWVNEPNTPPKPTFCSLHPRSPLAVFWSALIFVLVAVLIFILPLEIGFQHTTPPGADIVSTFYSIFVVVAFYLDIVVNFNCAYLNKDRKLITNSYQVAIHYMKGWLVLDLLSTVPSSILMLSNSNINNESTLEGSLNLFKVLKLLRLAKSIVAFRAFTSSRRNDSGILNMCAQLSLTRFHPSTKRLMTLGLVACLVLHWYACMWHFIGEVSQKHRVNNETMSSWIEVAVENRMFGNQLGERYIWSLYWSTTTLTTVGYGDISATNHIEAGFLVFVLMSGVFFYATLLGSVADHLGKVAVGAVGFAFAGVLCLFQKYQLHLTHGAFSFSFSPFLLLSQGHATWWSRKLDYARKNCLLSS